MMRLVDLVWFGARFLAALGFLVGVAVGQTTAFTYQGQLTNAGEPATGGYDLQFSLFASAAGGAPIGATKTIASVAVSNGVFSVSLDFGVSAFPGADRFLEIGVRPAGNGNFTTLLPRQPLTSTPYSIRASSAATADALSGACIGCVQSSQISSIAGDKVSGEIDVTNVPAGSASYIQNASGPRSVRGPGQFDNLQIASFGIQGDGTVGGTLFAGDVDVQNAYRVQGSPILIASGGADTFALSNTFVGLKAGASTSPADSGTNGNANSFFGNDAGLQNTDGFFNVFLGVEAGQSNSVGAANTFVGVTAGLSNLSGSLNSALGFDAIVGTDLTNATAIGARAKVEQSNSLVLGSIAGVNNATQSTYVGIGTTAPRRARLHVEGADGTAIFGGSSASDAIYGEATGLTSAGLHGANFLNADGFGVLGTTTAGTGVRGTSSSGRGVFGSSTTGIGVRGESSSWQGVSGYSRTQAGVVAESGITGSNDSFHAVFAVAHDVNSAGVFGSNDNAQGGFGVLGTSKAGAAVQGSSTSGKGVIGSADLQGIGVYGVNTNASGLAARFDGFVQVNGTITTSGKVCASNFPCSNSDARLKRDIVSLHYGLDEVMRLRPVTWKWKTDRDDAPQFGLVAQEVQPVLPEFVEAAADKEHTLSINYMALLPVVIKAIQDQQATIAQFEKRNAALEARLLDLERSAPGATVPNGTLCRQEAVGP